jgi:hypothetical protein
MLSNTGLRYDLEPLIELLPKIVWDEKNRCDINYPTGHWLHDPYAINDCWKNTAFEMLLSDIPFPIGEARLMKLNPGDCYRSHSDIDDRYHLNLISNDQSYLIDLDSKILHQIRPDGYLYKMDAGKVHTACNFGSSERIQLVIRIPLPRYTGENYVTKILKFNNPVFNFRYIFDNEISSFLNSLSKLGLLGFFNPKAETEIELHIEQEAFDKLLIKLKKIHKEIEIYD